ncbi:MAG: DUF3540 domain-containing protein [Byssovorax sp.]
MAAKSIKAAGATRRAEAAAVEAATLTALDEEGRAEVRLSAPTGGTEARPARIAAIAGYSPSVGDRVLVAPGRDGLYVIAVLHAARPLALRADDGATVEQRNGAIELRDPEGRLLVRYADGAAEIAAPARDLRLSAPNGRVVVSAGLDVSVEAARDVSHKAGRSLDLASGGAAQLKAARVDVESKASRVVTGEAAVLARAITTTAEHLSTSVGRYELSATRLVEKAKDAFRDVTDLLQARIGRSRTVVKDTYTLDARRTTVNSTEETSIDGSKILLG